MSGIGNILGHILHDVAAPVAEAVLPGAAGHIVSEAAGAIGNALTGEHDGPQDGPGESSDATDGAPAAAEGSPSAPARGEGPEGTPAGDRAADGQETAGAATGAELVTEVEREPAPESAAPFRDARTPGSLMVARCEQCARSAVVHAGADGYAPPCTYCGSLQEDVTPDQVAPAAPAAAEWV